MVRIVLVVAFAAAALSVGASSAAADAQWNGPDCQGSVISGAVGGAGLAQIAAQFGVSVQQAQSFVRSGCTTSTSEPPRCEHGQLQAADGALARGDDQQYLFHLGALEYCFLDEPPGPPL